MLRNKLLITVTEDTRTAKIQEIFLSRWIISLNFCRCEVMFFIKEKVLILLNLKEVSPLQKNHLLGWLNYSRMTKCLTS